MIDDGHVVTLGGVSLTARRTPGPHARHHDLDDDGAGRRASRIAWSFAGSTFVNPGTRLVKNPSYPGIEADYRRSFALLESLPVDMYLAAHAQAFDFHAKRERAKTEGPRAFVDPDALRKAVAASQGGIREAGRRRDGNATLTLNASESLHGRTSCSLRSCDPVLSSLCPTPCAPA